MIIPASIQQKYDLVSPYMSVVAERVRDIVRSYCDRSGFAYLGREKSADSLAEKIETGRYSSWSNIDDLFACSVIVPTLSCESGVLSFLREEFEQVECRGRSTSKKDPSVFRFDATRFVGRLKADSFSDGSESLLSIMFEVQIRTAFEHAWSVTTHAISYKSEQVDWRRIRLAAQLRAAVEQLDLVVSAFEQTASFINEQEWPDVVAKQSLQALFESELEAGALPSEVVPASWGRFCDNLYSLIVAGGNGRRDRDVLTGEAIAALREEIQNSRDERFPRSISLLQFCIGALVTRKVISTSLRRYTPLVTKELSDIYPAVKGLRSSFDIEL